MNNRVWIGAVLLGISASQVAAEDVTKWGEVGGWQVFVDAAVGNGCFIERNFDDGSRMRMGDLPNRDGNFLSVVNKEWTGIEEVDTVIVHFDLDGVVYVGDKPKYYAQPYAEDGRYCAEIGGKFPRELYKQRGIS